MAADGAIAFDADLLREASGRLESYRSAIGKELDGLSLARNRLVGAWTGEASEAFSAAEAKWSAEFARMSGILKQAISALDAAAQGYAEAEDANVRRWPG